MTRDSQSTEARTRFQLVNAVRPVLTAVATAFSFYGGEMTLGLVLGCFVVLGVAWFAFTLLRKDPELESGSLSYIPTFLDVSFLTAFVYYSGGALSAAVPTYVYVTAVSAMNTRVPQGIFAATYLSLLFSAVCLLTYLGWLAPRNVMGPIRHISGSENVVAIVVVATINFAVAILVSGLVRSLEGSNNSLSLQTEHLRGTTRALELAQKQMNRELLVARRIQQALLPAELPQSPHYSVATRYLALDAVGGDFLDCFSDREENLGLLVVDAAGHGVPASLVATMAKLAADRYRSLMHLPLEFLSAINVGLLDRTDLHFVAASYTYLRVSDLKLSYCVAGAPPIYLLRPGRPAEHLEGGGSVLGIRGNPNLVQRSRQLTPGDRLVMFTDGIEECRNEEGVELGEEQLSNLLTGVALESTSEGTAARILAEINAFTGERGFEDDVTIAVLTIHDAHG